MTSSVWTMTARTRFAAKIPTAITDSRIYFASASPVARRACLPGRECRRRRRWRLCFATIAGPAPMEHSGKQKTRTLPSQFSIPLGREDLKVRLYRDREAFGCEGELVERVGPSFTMVLPFKDP